MFIKVAASIDDLDQKLAGVIIAGRVAPAR
jgi:hypothetical protein